jgi:hypothetical protein
MTVLTHTDLEALAKQQRKKMVEDMDEKYRELDAKRELNDIVMACVPRQVPVKWVHGKGMRSAMMIQLQPLVFENFLNMFEALPAVRGGTAFYKDIGFYPIDAVSNEEKERARSHQDIAPFIAKCQHERGYGSHQPFSPSMTMEWWTDLDPHGPKPIRAFITLPILDANKFVKLDIRRQHNKDLDRESQRILDQDFRHKFERVSVYRFASGSSNVPQSRYIVWDMKIDSPAEITVREDWCIHAE